MIEVELLALILISLWGLAAVGKFLQLLAQISGTLKEMKIAIDASNRPSNG